MAFDLRKDPKVRGELREMLKTWYALIDTHGIFWADWIADQASRESDQGSVAFASLMIETDARLNHEVNCLHYQGRAVVWFPEDTAFYPGVLHGDLCINLDVEP